MKIKPWLTKLVQLYFRVWVLFFCPSRLPRLSLLLLFNGGCQTTVECITATLIVEQDSLQNHIQIIFNNSHAMQKPKYSPTCTQHLLNWTLPQYVPPLQVTSFRRSAVLMVCLCCWYLGCSTISCIHSRYSQFSPARFFLYNPILDIRSSFGLLHTRQPFLKLSFE